MGTKWQSQGLYEHPAKHQKGVYGNIIQSDVGIYNLKVGSSHMSCPQDWAAAIHAEETGQTGQMIIRQVPESIRREFKALCAREGKSMQEKLIELMSAAVAQK
jgi:hypothetical protein